MEGIQEERGIREGAKEVQEMIKIIKCENGTMERIDRNQEEKLNMNIKKDSELKRHLKEEWPKQKKNGTME